MTISLTNAGRGSGKTHDLIEWASKSPNRFVIGTFAYTGDAMEAAGLKDQFVHAVTAKQFFQGRRHYEVAIDNFEAFLPGILYTQYGIHPENDTVITSCFPEANMGKATEQSFIPTAALDSGIEFLQNIKKIFGEK